MLIYLLLSLYVLHTRVRLVSFLSSNLLEQSWLLSCSDVSEQNTVNHYKQDNQSIAGINSLKIMDAYVKEKVLEDLCSKERINVDHDIVKLINVGRLANRLN